MATPAELDALLLLKLLHLLQLLPSAYWQSPSSFLLRHGSKTISLQPDPEEIVIPFVSKVGLYF